MPLPDAPDTAVRAKLREGHLLTDHEMRLLEEADARARLREGHLLTVEEMRLLEEAEVRSSPKKKKKGEAVAAAALPLADVLRRQSDDFAERASTLRAPMASSSRLGTLPAATERARAKAKWPWTPRAASHRAKSAPSRRTGPPSSASSAKPVDADLAPLSERIVNPRTGVVLRLTSSLESEKLDTLPRNTRIRVLSSEQREGRMRVAVEVTGGTSPRGIKEGWVTAVHEDGRLLLGGNSEEREKRVRDHHVAMLAGAHWKSGPWFGGSDAKAAAARVTAARHAKEHERSQLTMRAMQFREERDAGAKKRAAARAARMQAPTGTGTPEVDAARAKLREGHMLTDHEMRLLEEADARARLREGHLLTVEEMRVLEEADAREKLREGHLLSAEEMLLLEQASACEPTRFGVVDPMVEA